MGEFLLIGGEPFYLNQSSRLHKLIMDRLKGRRRLLLLGTAFGDDQFVVNRIMRSEFAMGFDVTHLNLFNTHKGWRKDLAESDIVLIPGGSTRSMLAVWNEWRVPGILYNSVKNGTTIIGVSAGAICWFDQYVTDSDAEGLTLEAGLGFLPGTAIAHAETMLANCMHELEGLGINPGNNDIVKIGESELRVMRL